MATVQIVWTVGGSVVKEDRRRKRRFAEPHVRLHMWLLRSDAWLSLTAPARTIYVQLASRYNGSNNGRIGYSVRKAAEECHLSKGTVCRAFSELAQVGFIELKTPGAFSLKVRHAAEWLLTEFRDDVSSDLPKKTFMKWRRNQNAVPN